MFIGGLLSVTLSMSYFPKTWTHPLDLVNLSPFLSYRCRTDVGGHLANNPHWPRIPCVLATGLSIPQVRPRFSFTGNREKGPVVPNPTPPCIFEDLEGLKTIQSLHVSKHSKFGGQGRVQLWIRVCSSCSQVQGRLWAAA